MNYIPFQVLELFAEELVSEKFNSFIAYIAFSLAKRCFIRPGALTQMTIKEFENPVYRDPDSVLVHVKGTIP